MGALDLTVGLIYTLQADTSQAEKEIKNFDRATDKIGQNGKAGLDSLTSSASAAGAGFLSMVNPVTLAVTAVTAVATAAVTAGIGLFNLASSASEFGSEIYDASEKTGLSAETLSSMKFAAEQAGSSLESVSAATTKFTKLVAEAAQGSEEANKKLKALGVDPQTAIKDLDGSLGKVFQRIASLPDPVSRTKAAIDAFGKSGAELLPFIRSFDGDLPGLIAKAKELGVVLSDEDAAAADEFGDTLDTLKAQATGVANQFALGFMPAITKTMQEISGSLKNNKNVWREWGEYTGKIISNLVRGVQLAIAVFKDLDNARMGIFTGTNIQNTFESFRQSDSSPEEAGSDGQGRKPRADSEDYLTESASTKKEKDPTKDWTLTKVLDAMRKGTMAQESGGNPNARNKRTGASGMFQVMPNNIRDWTRDTFGFEMSPEAFKKDTQAQITIFNKYMGAYLKKGLEMSKGDWDKAIRIAAVQWYGTGKGAGLGYDDPTKFQKNEPTRREYTSKVLSRTKKFLTGKGEDFDFNSEKEQIENAKRIAEDAVKTREAADKRVLEGAKRTANEEKAINENMLAQKKITQDEFDKRSEQSAIDLLNKEKILLDDRLKLAKDLGVETVEIEQNIADVVSQIKVKQSEAETAAYLKSKKYLEDLKQLRLEVAEAQRELYDASAAGVRQDLRRTVDNTQGKARLNALIDLRDFELSENERRRLNAVSQAETDRKNALDAIEDKEKEKEKVDEINKIYEKRLETIQKIKEVEDGETNDDFQPDINKARDNSSPFTQLIASVGAYLENVALIRDANGQLQFSFEQVFSTMKDLGLQAFASLAQGFGQMVGNWVLYGNTGGQTLRKMTAQVLSQVATMATTYALMSLAAAALASTAWGAAILGGTPSQFLQAAAAFGAVAVGAAVGGRLIAGNAFNKETGTGKDNPATGGITNGNGQGQRGRGGAWSPYGDEVKTYENGMNEPEQNINVQVTVKTDRNSVIEIIEHEISRDRSPMSGLIRGVADWL